MKATRQTPTVFFSGFKAMWYAKNIYGNEGWYYTQVEAEKFAGLFGKTEKQKIEYILKAKGIVSKVKINKNEIHVKYDKDFKMVADLFPKMAVVYGFIN